MSELPERIRSTCSQRRQSAGSAPVNGRLANINHPAIGMPHSDSLDAAVELSREGTA